MAVGKSMAWVSLGVLAMLSAAARGQEMKVVVEAASDAPPQQPAQDANGGALGEARGELAAILKLAAPEGKLVLDRESWKAAAEEDEKAGDGAAAKVAIGNGVVAGGNPAGLIVVNRAGPRSDLARLLQKVQAKTGSRRTSMSTSGTRTSGSFGGERLECTYAADETSLELLLRETGASGRMLRFRADPEGGLYVLLLDATGENIVILIQDAAGRVTATQIAGEKVTRAKAASFQALTRDRREFVEKTLQPALEAVGVSFPMTSWSQPVRSAILEMLRSPGNAPLGPSVAQQIAKLDSDKAAEREAATDVLSKAFLACYKDLKAAQANPASSAEVKTRIQEIFRRNRAKLEPAALIESLGLLRDAELLADMLKNATSDEDKKALSEALGKLKK